MTVQVEIAKPKELLKHALKRMVNRNIGSLVVVEAGNPVGIITERDISRCVAKGSKALRIQVKNLMSSPLITVTRSATIQDAVRVMLKHGIRRLPVVEKGKMVGIISDRDVLRWMLRITYESSLLLLPPHFTPEIKEILERQPVSKK
jgi:CBS domain-containing protein